ncbi:DEAD/DEAH box helicase family protein [Lysinibacillus fusiformis]|uniref:DEAD/DEAH box helicase n=1 Tax=Lysinibacillus fusiformis TaxID=28031 RepID=UPI002E995B14|nr:DEAD/DEAH box helicase family protein [Lysinibacillus fusiformis]
MIIDFSKLNGNDSIDTILDPREIFDLLPEKDPKYDEYLRDVQTEVLNKWFDDSRDKKDVILKMNTGSGKTVVGLLMLKSCLNEKKGPAVYVVPDPYLVKQVMEEAHDLGIAVTDNINDSSFRKGEAILVINIYKLMNGKSNFGVNEVKVNIGSIVIDDAHACLDITEEQFTINIPKDSEVYSFIFELFKESIKQQSEIGLIELECSEPNAISLVPFWTWCEKTNEVMRILHSHKDSKDPKLKSLIFGWPFLKDNLHLCKCIIGSDGIEISPNFLPIHTLTSFENAKRRIFMSATISDDSVLVSHFNIDHTSITNAITPNSSNDIGERMILIPQELNPSIEDSDLKLFYKQLSQTNNVVIIVPSNYRARFWSDIADMTLNTSNLNVGIQALKNGHVGLVVVINKYDGIDLPKSACTILVIDGLPDVRSKRDRIQQSWFRGNELLTSGIIQKIEQGMGRGIRSKDDYCVVFLMGRSLVNHLYVNDALSHFTPATRKQIELSDMLAKQIRGKDLNDLNDVINYALSRNIDWIKTSKGALVKIKYESNINFNEKILLERKAYNEALKSNYRESSRLLLEAINKETNPIITGVLKQELAEYLQFYDPVEAQQTLMSAVNDNNQIIHPIEGIVYNKLMPSNVSQAQQLIDFINENFKNLNKFAIYLNNLIEKLIFLPKTSNAFEQAIMDLAFVLGFKGQRPENEYNRGPDNLWSIGNSKYFVIECKNGSESAKIIKHDCNQLNGSINWFYEKYDENNSCIPIMIHKSIEFEYAAAPNKNIRIINEEKLNLLKDNLANFSSSIPSSITNVQKIDELLEMYSFKEEQFIKCYSLKYV